MGKKISVLVGPSLGRASPSSNTTLMAGSFVVSTEAAVQNGLAMCPVHGARGWRRI